MGKQSIPRGKDDSILLQKLARKKGLQKEIASIRRELKHCGPDRVNECNVAAGEARVRVENFIARFHSEDRIPEPQKKALQRLKAKAETAAQAFRSAKEKYDELTARSKALRAEMNKLTENWDLEEFLELQSSLESSQELVSGLRAAVEEERGIVEQVGQEMSDVDLFRKRREDLLALIALGEASTDDVTKLDLETRDQTQELAAKMAKVGELKSIAEQTVVGLFRKLEQAEAELNILKKAVPEIMADLLKQEAEVICKEYVELAAKIGEKFAQLLGLNRLICTITEGLRGDFLILGPYSLEMKVPEFKLKACGGLNESKSFLLFNGKSVNIAQAEGAERERLGNLGIVFPTQGERGEP